MNPPLPGANSPGAAHAPELKETAIRPWPGPCINVKDRVYVFVRKCIFSNNSWLNCLRKKVSMLILAALICLLVLLASAGADLFLDQFNSDDLSNMGIQRR